MKAQAEFDVGFEADDDFAFVDFDAPDGAASAMRGQPDISLEALEAELGGPEDLTLDEEEPQAHAPAAQPAVAARPALIDPHAGSDTGLGEAAVPRITIHAFSERDETAQLIAQALADRRLARATVSTFEGGLTRALEHYQTASTPALIVVEGSESAPQLLAQLDQLAEVCDPGTKVVVLGAANDVGLYRELMRRGVSEYLVPPLQPMSLIRAITGLYADPSAPFMGRQIAFLGAKGGSGASTLAHNLAYSISERMQANTVLVDFDLPFGTAGLDFNQDPIHGVVDALSQPDRLDPVLLDRMMVRCTDRLSLFAAPATLEDDYDISAEAFEEVAGKIRTTAPFVIIDLPHVWSAWMRRMLISADDLVVVATPDLASLRNAKNMIDLVRLARPNDAPPRLVLNQVGVPGRPEIPVKDFAEALGLEPSLCLPFDPKTFGMAANNGQMLEQVNAKAKCAEGIAHLAQLITRREPPPPRKPTSLLDKFVKRRA